MVYHHTKTKGDLGVLKAQTDLFSKGYIINIPLSEHSPYDLIIYKEGVCKTVQVKARSLNTTGVLTVDFRSCWTDKHGSHVKYVDKSLINVYCVYCLNNDQCYYFDPKKFNKSISLRVEAPKNNQLLNLNLAIDYKEVP